MRRSVTLILSQRASRGFHPRKDHRGRHTEVMKLLSVSSIQNAKEEAIFSSYLNVIFSSSVGGKELALLFVKHLLIDVLLSLV